ncbi:Dyp-type peroxidase [Agreia sp.]|uniref:Dyp-type peroxidase n=1 Tax=Agreia sp. TaxID=1872416 RepID=UPI0035BBE958
MASGESHGVDRRSVLFGLGGLATGVVAGAAGWNATAGGRLSNVDPETSDPAAVDPASEGAAGAAASDGAGAPVNASGRYQPGIHRPSTPQRHGLVMVLDIAGDDLSWLGALGDAILGIADGSHADVTRVAPDGVGDLSVTVGLGPRLISTVGPELPGAADLPAFADDDGIPLERRGGDVMLAAYGSDPTILRPVLELLLTQMTAATPRWEQRGFRGPGTSTVARNPFGFLDGIIVPRTDDEFDDNVWIQEGPLAGGTVCVLRRLRLDIVGFQSRSRDEQEAIIGRKAGTGAPLSGGAPTAQIDLRSKTPEGQYTVPAHAHARAAHPSFTGSELMLRRGYTFDDGLVDGVADAGLLFMCYQRSLRTFTATQQRLDELDALSEFSTPTGSATFLILPGFSRESPLGSTLR